MRLKLQIFAQIKFKIFSNSKNVSIKEGQKNLCCWRSSSKVSKTQRNQDRTRLNFLLMKALKILTIKIGVKYLKIIVIKIWLYLYIKIYAWINIPSKILKVHFSFGQLHIKNANQIYKLCIVITASYVL